MNTPQPLDPTPTPQVPLERAPLARVISQARFPPILGVRNRDKVAVFQEALREDYPFLQEEHVHQVDLPAGQNPSVQKEVIWRLANQQQNPEWRVSLGVSFIALETSDYESRQDFLARMEAVVHAVGRVFKPPSVTRLGLRYIDRLTGPAVEQIDRLVRPEFLGLAHSGEARPLLPLRDSLLHMMTDALFLAADGNQIHGRWGELPPNATYDPNALEPVPERSWVLDLDMFTNAAASFTVPELVATTRRFAESIYWLFRQIVTDDFLRFFGGRS